MNLIGNLQLVFDCAEPDEIMRFWGSLLGYRNDLVGKTLDELKEWRRDFPHYDGRGRIDDVEHRRMAIYIQRVPEAKRGRNRIRPEIADPDAASLAGEIVALGGKPAGGGFVDVEGNELTVVEGPERRLSSIVIDALDPPRLLEFWSRALGYVPTGDRCDPAPGAMFVLPFSDFQPHVLDLAPGLRFVATSHEKRVKNRLHLDIQNRLHPDPEMRDPQPLRDRLLGLGATVLTWDEQLRVFADPEGNELCAF